MIDRSVQDSLNPRQLLSKTKKTGLRVQCIENNEDTVRIDYMIDCRVSYVRTAVAATKTSRVLRSV